MIIKGLVHKFGDNVNTDEIIPAVYLATTDIKELGRHCMEGIDATFPRRVKKGDIIIAGKNFGCGSSREHAPLAIKATGVSLVIAKSFARIFYRNAINIGLAILPSGEAYENVNPQDELRVDLAKGEIRNVTEKKTFYAEAFPPLLEEIIEAGGLIKWYSKKF
ncbi:MAG TPA: 3-isopropylmalate dehydratase small subunit [Candidatus Omnitrophica bacterium]|nr:3-isopropylmalate dehydratase small subunit [Candidatus Omnitrophota bacterium]